jgi:sugar phosphate isomerase/epimerase
MKLGIKVGPEKESLTNIELTHTQFVEVWFRIDKKDDYDDLFDYVAVHKIETGLHFWGLTHDGLVPTLSHDDPSLLKESMDLMKQTITLASTHAFSYVNIHPGFRTRIGCEYKNLVFSNLHERIVSYEQATIHFLKCMEELTEFAKSKNVLLTVETTPIRLPVGSLHEKENRNIVEDFSEYSYIDLPVDTLKFAIANDFGHTAANCIADDPNAVWDLLYKKTVAYAPKTRLLHLGYIVPPYNGSDFHDQMDNPSFETNLAIPNSLQMMTLLQLFKNRDDIFALVEPNGQHPKNYFLAQKILQQAGV